MDIKLTHQNYLPFYKKALLHFFLLVIISFPAGFILAQPVLETFAVAEGSSGSAVVAKPAGVVAGNLMVVGLTFEKGSDVAITAPGGWILIRRTNNGTDVGMATYYKIAGGSEPSSYSFGLTNGPKWCIGNSRISNVDGSPINVSLGATGDGNPVGAPSVNTTDGNTLILCYYTNKKAATYTPAGGTTERYDDPNNGGGLPSNMLATFVQTNQGATGKKDATASESEKWAAQQVAISPLVPLPVELSAFNGQAMERSNLLKWQTASEENTEVFIVERSIGGVNDFKEIDRINAFGNSATLRNYTTEDLNPVALAYYRLRIVDFDGSFEYSDIIVVERSKSAIDLVEVYPVPAKDEVTVLIHAQADGNAVITISDFTGRKIKEEKMDLKSGVNRYVFNANEHEANFYFLTIDNGKEKFTKKILGGK